VLRGRAFSAADRAGAGAVALVSHSLAQALWPNEDAIGRRLKLAPAHEAAEWITVIGIVADRYDIGRGEGGPPRRARAELYCRSPRARAAASCSPARQHGRTDGPGRMRGALQPIDIDQPITDVMSQSDLVYDNVRVQRGSVALRAPATLALLLSAIGRFGVIAYAVTQRKHEIGIRMALGAEPNDVVRLVLGVGARLVLWGIGIGLLSALAASQFLTMVVFGASPRDPLTLGFVSVLLAAVALTATWLPARRAARVDPIQAMTRN
jgi:hypothetical protein